MRENDLVGLCSDKRLQRSIRDSVVATRIKNDTESNHMSQGKPDQYNAVGAGQFMKLGTSTSEAVGKPGTANKVAPSMAANGMGGGWEETRPGGAEKNMASPEQGDSAFGKPGGSQAIKPA